MLHTYNRAPHIQPCSTKGVLPGIFGEPFLKWLRLLVSILAQGIDVSGENEMAHTVALNFHQTTGLHQIWAEAWSALGIGNFPVRMFQLGLDRMTFL